MMPSSRSGTVGGLFDGVGLLAYGLHQAGWDHAWLCEVDPWRRTILNKRFPGARIYDDVRAVGADAPAVTLIAGGFPCKGASVGGKRNGFDHAETVLWFEMARAIGEIRPRYVLVENVANILGLHDGAVWGTVLGDLAALGYDVTWDCLPAAAVGAPHLRDRVFAVACHADSMAGQTSLPCDRRPGPMDEPGPLEQAQRSDRHLGAVADTDRDGVRQQPVAERWSEGAPVAADAGEAPADAGRAGRQEHDGTAVAGGTERTGSPVDVDWAEYTDAIRRWEAVAGPAPEPLLRGMDDRAARRVVKSRLSALGDGVQVQVGYIVGSYIAQLERERVTSVAA